MDIKEQQNTFIIGTNIRGGYINVGNPTASNEPKKEEMNLSPDLDKDMTLVNMRIPAEEVPILVASKTQTCLKRTREALTRGLALSEAVTLEMEEIKNLMAEVKKELETSLKKEKKAESAWHKAETSLKSFRKDEKDGENNYNHAKVNYDSDPCDKKFISAWVEAQVASSGNGIKLKKLESEISDAEGVLKSKIDLTKQVKAKQRNLEIRFMNLGAELAVITHRNYGLDKALSLVEKMDAAREDYNKAVEDVQKMTKNL